MVDNLFLKYILDNMATVTGVTSRNSLKMDSWYNFAKMLHSDKDIAPPCNEDVQLR